jgi:hypothetical protein
MSTEKGDEIVTERQGLKRTMIGLLFMPLALLVLPGMLFAGNTHKLAFTESFPVAECSFANAGGNAYFLLEPGRQLYYTNEACLDEGACNELVELTITVLSGPNSTKEVKFNVDGTEVNVTTRIVMEEEWANGELAETSWNYFAVCQGGNDVYYFGEDVDIYGEGGSVSHEGAWLAGKNGAMPGIVMPGGAFLLGSRYYQEVAPGVALDRAEHVAMGLEIDTEAGTFQNCVEVLEDTPLEKKSGSTKTYCPNVGLVIDDELILVDILSD